MYKTWRISFALKNTYRVNTILYAFKQIPLVKRLLPETLYRVRSLKLFANILSAIWELLSVFNIISKKRRRQEDSILSAAAFHFGR